jgi:hypothetical protein
MTDGPEAREIHPDSPEGKTRGEVEAAKELTDLFRSRVIDPKNIDVGRLFEQCFGSHEYFSHRRNRSMPYDLLYRRPLLEAQGAVSSASFLNITGQIVYGSVLDKYEVPEFAFSKMIPERPAITLRGEKIAGVTNIGDEIMERGEGKPYALAGVSEDWIETPQIVDRGLEVDLTWEAVFEDKTGQLLDQAGGVGRSMGINKEKRAIDAVVDENTTRHRYRWRGTTIATYGDNSGSHSWDNLAASNGLVDWTDLDNVEQVRNGITDPYTGEPVEWELTDLIVTKQNEKTAERILRATEIRVATPGYATSANPTLTNVANPYTNKYQLVSSLWLATRMATDTDWFVGNVAKAVACMMAQKMEVRQAAAGNPDELKRRIVSQFYVNEMSEFVVVQPRLLLKSTA